MKAVLCKQWGDPSTLVIEDVPSKAPAASEARLAVRACGINFADTLIIQGQYQVKPAFPFSPGLEVAGEVIEVGADVTHLLPGDRVLATTQYGGLAQEVCVPAAMALPIPDNMEFVTAASFAVAYGTSHVALTHRGNLKPGETLLVLGAAGGVGLTAVEIGKLLGAKVIAAASTPEKLELAKQYGADHLVDYTKENIRDQVKAFTNGKGADVIYDPVGGSIFEQVMRCVAWEGRVLVIGFASGTIPQLPVNLTLVKNCSVVGVYWGAYALNKPKVLIDSLHTLLGWYAEGKLKPHISAIYPLERAAEALNALIQRRSTGKVVVTI
jgi:NADPH2:quinone reductase